MAYINLVLSTKIARLQTLNHAVGANATVVIYDGLYPSSPDVVSHANALAVFTCNPTAFGNVAVQPVVIGQSVTNVATLVSNPFPPVFSNANGIAGWARINDVTGNAVIDLDIALPNSNIAASIVMNSTDLIANVPVQIVSIIISEQ